MTVAVPVRQAETAAIAEPVGDLIAHALAEIGVTTVFGVISIHNMPILDAIARQGRIRFVPARGEAGAMNMADAYARVSRSLGVVITSTGTAAGNAAGSQVEALTAGSPVLHITSQIDRPWMDRDRAAIHDVPRQADMLRAVSKAYFRVWEGRTAVGMVEAAARAALTAAARSGLARDPDRRAARESGAAAPCRRRPDRPASPPIRSCSMSWPTSSGARERPMLWLGGGAREAATAARDLAERGFAVVTSTNGRAVVPETHPHTLGAFNMTAEAQAIYDRADLMIVVGSRLRGNETRNNAARLPHPLVQIDADAGPGRAQLRGRSLRQCRRGGGARRPARAAAGAARGRREISRRHRDARAQIGAQARRCARPLSGRSPTRCRRASRAAAPVRARRHALEQHLRQSLRAARGAPSRRACARRRHRAGRRDGGGRGARRRAGEDHRARRRRRRHGQSRRARDRGRHQGRRSSSC